MSKKTSSGNRIKKRLRVCSKCHTIYSARGENPCCPNCGKSHHTKLFDRIEEIAKNEYCMGIKNE
jgi:PHP family Zn ribbon phosphoesterase